MHVLFCSYFLCFSLTGCEIARQLILQMLIDSDLATVNVDRISEVVHLLATQFSCSHSQLKFTIARLLFECLLLCGKVIPLLATNKCDVSIYSWCLFLYAFKMSMYHKERGWPRAENGVVQIVLT